METQEKYITLVEAARRGDKQSLNQLAGMAKGKLTTFVYRLTQNNDLTQEIVQESLLEMCRVLGKLKQNDRFWSWLYGIATNKLHRHYRTEKTQRNAAAAEERRRGPMKERNGGLENLVSQELKQIVAKAMQKLRTRHKAVLVMRCYDEMSYAEIAESMGCSEFSTRMLFVRAKRCLQKELSRSGFGRGSLLAALIVFGKMTAPSKAAAAELTVPVAATKAGLLAGAAVAATTKTALVSVATVGVLTAGTITATLPHGRQADNPAAHLATSTQMAAPFGAPKTAQEKYWYFYPQGPQGPVMVRAELEGRSGRSSQVYLQNQFGNFCRQGGTVYENNHRIWHEDLSVMRLPTDSRTLSSFLSSMEGEPTQMQSVSAKGNGLLVILERDEDKDGQVESPAPFVMHHDNVLQEDYFRNDWPAGVRVVNNRDAMHRRGWTYMRISGQIAGQQISGTGRVPFVYAASQVKTPWLKLQIGPDTVLVDSPSGAVVQNAAGDARTRYSAGAFFKGLGRPWMGLHAMDTVRRDAAEERIPFVTQLAPNQRDVEITVGQDPVQLVYTIDLEADLVTKIEFFKDHVSVGQLAFDYLQNVDGDLSEFKAPGGGTRRILASRNPGIQWLIQLAQ